LFVALDNSRYLILTLVFVIETLLLRFGLRIMLQVALNHVYHEWTFVGQVIGSKKHTLSVPAL
jgi:hypothetical protein